jgi:polar amino acid transport system substrate-binding protein
LEKISKEVRGELAPGGKIRVGLNYQNFLLVLGDAPDGSPKGIAPDLGRALGEHSGLEIEFVRFDSAGKLADAVKDGAWDVAFLGSEPARAQQIAFSSAYLEIPVTFLVPANSPIRKIEDVDKDGVRVAVADKSAYDLFLTRTLKKAKLMRVPGIPQSYDLFVNEKLEALSGLKPRLVSDAERLPGSRILDGQVTGVQQSAGVPRARDHAAAWVSKFIEDIKASGFVAETIRKHGVRGVTVAPAAQSR